MTQPGDQSSLRVEDWGRTRYREALERQRTRVLERREGSIPDTLIFTEHELVYTIGVRKGAERHLLWDEQVRKRMGVEVEPTNRGGDITFHGPGQIVGYPIFDLRQTKDLHRYLRDLEESLILAIQPFGLSGTRRNGMTGIWIGTRKIAAIGVAVRSWITWHGFALNLHTDLRYFQGIVPCGITEGSVTSLANELGDSTPEPEEMKQQLAQAFRTVFS